MRTLCELFDLNPLPAPSAGAPDLHALLHDALDRKLVSVTVVRDMALAYEAKITALHATHAATIAALRLQGTAARKAPGRWTR